MIWQNKPFVRMFSAYAVTTFGEWFDAIALMILFSYIWHAEPLLIAMLPLTLGIPGILFGQLAGILADRWRKADLMIAADLLRAIITACLLIAPGPQWVLPLLVLRSCASVFNIPAQQALTRTVVEQHLLFKATALNGMVFQTSKIFGPMLGASLSAVWSPQAAIMVNAIGFLASALILLPLRKFQSGNEAVATNSNSEHESEKRGLRAMWKEGWAAILGNRVLTSSLMFGLTGFIAIQLVDFQFAVVLREAVPDRPELTGWVISAIGTGALATVSMLSRMRTISSYGWYQAGGILLIGLMILQFGLFKPGMWIGMPLLAALLGGIGTGLTSITINYLMQKETPKDAVGRVTGIYSSVMNAVMIVSPPLGGMLITMLGADRCFQIIGLAICLIGLLGVSLQKRIWVYAATTKTNGRSVQ